jgi:DNA-binding transcriptional regulator LsrR (DeoR family)
MQYRGRVKGKEANDAYVVARLYYEQKLVQQEVVRRPKVAVVGIGGGIDASCQHAPQGDYLGDEALTGAAAGDVCAHYFDIGGRALGGELEAGLIAIGWEDLGRVLMAIGVAGGPGKVSGILGAVRSGLVNALVTDEETAASRPRLSEAA